MPGIALQCDGIKTTGEPCGNSYFGGDGSLVQGPYKPHGYFFTQRTELVNDARTFGWTVATRKGVLVDLCPTCTEERLKQKERNIMANKKHPQFILAMDASYFTNHPTFEFKQGFNVFPSEDFIKEAQSHLVIRERETLEKDPTYRQVLPYVIVRQRNSDGKILYQPYRRTSMVGESRLAGNVSIGYGGHIDYDDIATDQDTPGVVNLYQTIFLAAAREVQEELNTRDHANTTMFNNTPLTFPGYFILDDTNEVGKVHVGVIMFLDLPDNIDLDINEEELTYMPQMTAEQLAASDLPIENWSRIFFDKAQGENWDER